VDVLMAQPLRLGAMAEEGKVDLSSVRLLVLDEADKLFDMGFTEQVRQGGWGMGDGVGCGNGRGLRPRVPLGRDATASRPLTIAR
jgi:hypothetical protein